LNYRCDHWHLAVINISACIFVHQVREFARNCQRVQGRTIFNRCCFRGGWTVTWASVCHSYWRMAFFFCKAAHSSKVWKPCIARLSSKSHQSQDQSSPVRRDQVCTESWSTQLEHRGTVGSLLRDPQGQRTLPRQEVWRTPHNRRREALGPQGEMAGVLRSKQRRLAV
jgi:hypothetical protein